MKLVKANKILIVMLTIFLLLMAFTATIVSAWFVPANVIKGMEWESGSLEIAMEINGEDTSTVTNFNLKGLQYLDLKEDFVDDKTKTFDLLTRTIKIEVTVTPTSAPLSLTDITSNIISTNFADRYLGLIYMINVETVTDPLNHVWFNDYHSKLKGLMGGNITVAHWEQELFNYNKSMVDFLENKSVSNAEPLFMQISFWGDYNNLPSGSDYLTKSHAINLAMVWKQFIS